MDRPMKLEKKRTFVALLVALVAVLVAVTLVTLPAHRAFAQSVFNGIMHVQVDDSDDDDDGDWGDEDDDWDDDDEYADGDDDDGEGVDDDEDDDDEYADDDDEDDGDEDEDADGGEGNASGGNADGEGGVENDDDDWDDDGDEDWDDDDDDDDDWGDDDDDDDDDDDWNEDYGSWMTFDDEIPARDVALGSPFEFTTGKFTWQCREYGVDGAVVYGVEFDGDSDPTTLIIPSTVKCDVGNPTRTVKGIVSCGEYDKSAGDSIDIDDRFDYSSADEVVAISIPETVEFIGVGAFYCYWDLKTVTFEGQSQLKSIESGAFINCKKLEQFNNTGKVTIPASVESIGRGAFTNCASMQAIVFPAGAQVDECAVENACSALTSIENAPAYLEVNAAAVTSVTFSPGIEEVEGVYLENPETLQTVVLPEGLKSISWDAFADCTSLVSCNLPSTLTTIDEGAFYNCSSLMGIDALPAGVTEVGNNAFWGCKNLHMAVKHPGDSLKYQYANSGITSIELSSSIKTCLNSAFCGCEDLQAITGGNERFRTVDGVLYGPYNKKVEGYFLSCYPAGKSGGSYTVPATVADQPLRELGSFAFDSCKFSEIHLPASLEGIPQGAAANLGLYDDPESDDIGLWWAFDHMKTNPVVYYVKGSEADKILKENNYMPREAEPVAESKVDISSYTATLEYAKGVFNGKPLCPEVTVEGLKKDKDFTVRYENNEGVGTAAVAVEGIGKYSGEIGLNFDIVPAQAKLKKAKPAKPGKKRIKVKAVPVEGMSYQVSYRMGAGEWVTKDMNGAKLTIKKLKKNREYTVRVRAYQQVGGKAYYGDWSDAKTVTVK